jgi:hypothetical protein
MSCQKFFAPILVLTAVIVLAACSESPPTKTDGNSPAAPTLLGPANNGSDIALGETLVWRCSDPNGDALTYALYFGVSNPPPLLIDKLLDTAYVVKDLEPGKTYYWRVVASDDDGHSAGSQVITFATTRSFQYPLAVGNRWGYDWTIVQDSVSGAATPSTSVSEATISVEADTLLFDSVPALILHENTGNGRPGQSSRLYSSNTSEGMFTYAYTNGSLVAPGKVPTGSFVVNGQRFASPEELLHTMRELGQGSARAAGELFVEDPPVMVFAYPLEEGSHWTYRTAGNPWRVDRRITGWTAIETPAGKFNAFTIEALFDMDNDGAWDTNISFVDQVAPQGLVRRQLTVLGIEVRDGSDAVVGIIDFHETYLLRDYHSE